MDNWRYFSDERFSTAASVCAYLSASLARPSEAHTLLADMLTSAPVSASSTSGDGCVMSSSMASIERWRHRDAFTASLRVRLPKWRHDMSGKRMGLSEVVVEVRRFELDTGRYMR